MRTERPAPPATPLLRQLARSLRQEVNELLTEYERQPGNVCAVLDELMARAVAAPLTVISEAQRASRGEITTGRDVSPPDDDGDEPSPRWLVRRVRW